jgi:PAS domain S-box-containing protein
VGLATTDKKTRWGYAAVLCLVFAAIVASAVQSYRTIDRELTDLALSRRASVSYLAAQLLTEKLDRLTDIGISLATRVRFREMVEAGNWAEAGRILASVPNDFPFIERTTLLDRTGTLMVDVPEIPGVSGNNFAYRPWFQEALRTRQPHISQVYRRFAPPQLNVFVAAIPIKNSKSEVMGILAVQVSTVRFFAWIRSLEAGPGGVVYVVDQRGGLAAHPKFSSRGELIDYSGVPVVRRLLEGGRGVDIVSNPGENNQHVVAFEPATKHGWGVVLEQPTANVFAARDEQLRRILASYGFVLICVIGVAYLASRVFVQRRLVDEGQRTTIALEHAVAERTARLETINKEIEDLYNSAPCGYHSLDENGVFVRINDTWLKWIGYGREEVVGKMKKTDILTPPSIQEFEKSFSILKERGEVYDVEYEILRKDGSIFPVSLSATAIRDRAGKYLMSRSTLFDITQRRRAEKRVAAQHAVTRVLAESGGLDEGARGLLQVICENMRWEVGTLWSVDRAANVLRCVEMWHKTSFDADEFRTFTTGITFAPGQGMPGRVWQSGDPFWVSNRVADPGFPRGIIGIKYGLKAAFGFPIRLRDEVLGVVDFFGSEMPPLDEELSRMFTAIGSQIGQFIERKRAEEENRALNVKLQEHASQLEAANRELESFAYSVSHDLRSPLRAIDGFSMIMEEDYVEKLDDEGRRLLGVIRRNSQKMGQLIDDLLAFSRLGRKPVVAAEVDMSELVRESLKEIQAHPDVVLPQCLIQKLPVVWGDRVLLRQVWINLLANAVKFTRTSSSPLIEVSGNHTGQETVYCVKDNGVGFDMKYYDKLFGVFQRLHSDEEFPGTGVGLAIVQRVVSRHGGRVWAEGVVNGGASFYFSLPDTEIQNG